MYQVGLRSGCPHVVDQVGLRAVHATLQPLNLKVNGLSDLKMVHKELVVSRIYVAMDRDKRQCLCERVNEPLFP